MDTYDMDTYMVETFVIGPGFDVPELTTIRGIDWVDRLDKASIATTYFDTADHLLARRGITLCQESDGELGTWFVTSVGLHQRQLIGVGVAQDPAALAPLVGGLIGGRELFAVLTVTTLRETSLAFDDDGETTARISIDRVSACLVVTPHQWRKWDVMSVDFPTGDQDGLADQVRRKLTGGGAYPSADLGRLEQILGVHQPERPRKLAGLVYDYLMPELDRLLFNDVALRRGAADTAYGTWLAARRLLSVVRVMAEVFEAEPARQLTAELGWFAGILGAVTDCETRRKRLRRALTSANVAPGHLAGRQVVKQELDLDREMALLTLQDTLHSNRYAALIQMLADWRAAMPFAPLATNKKQRSVRRYLERAEAELEWRLHAVHDVPTEPAMHAARQAARRTRFVAELAQPALGKPARLARSNAIEIQDRLGEHRDAVIAADLSSRLTAVLDGAARELLMSLASDMDRQVDIARKRSLSVCAPLER
jgi:CHAD domain-containing protein